MSTNLRLSDGKATFELHQTPTPVTALILKQRTKVKQMDAYFALGIPPVDTLACQVAALSHRAAVMDFLLRHPKARFFGG